MAKGQKSQIVTKKHLARQQRERLQNRYIVIISAVVIVIVLGLIGYGIIQQYVIQPQQPVAKVNNVDITAKDFQTYARYMRLQYIQQYQQYQQFAQLFGSDQSSLSYIQNILSQIEYTLQPTNIGQSALDYLIANQIIQQEADTRGISVSDEEVNTYLENYFGYFPNGTPTSTATIPAVPTSTLNPTQLVLVPPTATASPTATLTPAPTITTTVETATPTVVSTPTAVGATSTPQPSATPYTTQVYAQNLATYIANINSFAELTEADFRWIFKMQLLRQKVMDAITADVPRDQDQVWARHIVASTQEQAQSIYQRLENGGDFTIIANEVMSNTTTTSIDLGWFAAGSGTIDTAAETTVWGLQVGQISEPIQTANGWEVFQVLGHEVRQLTDAQFQTLKSTDFNDWITKQETAENVQRFDVWKTLVPTSPTIPPTATGQ